MAKVTELSRSEATVPGPDGKPATYTYVTYRAENGRIGMVVIPKKDPTDADVAAAIRRQAEEAAKRKPKEISL